MFGAAMAKQHLNLDAASLEALLAEEGWQCTRITHDTWRSKFRGKSQVFDVLVRIDPDGYFTCAIVPFLKSPEDDGVATKLYDRLLQLNQVLFMAKFSIDDDLDIVLSVEYPTHHIDRSEVVDALEHLTYYAEEHFEELRRIAV